MARKNYTPAERALHILGALAGKSCQEINDAVTLGDASKMVPAHRHKKIPQGSLDMLKQRYVHTFGGIGRRLNADFWSDIWDHCVRPKKMSDL